MDATLSFAEAVRQGERLKGGSYKYPAQVLSI